MNLTKEQVQAALAAGLHMTDPDSDTPVPMKFAAGAVILNKLLVGIASGKVTLNTALQPGTPPPPKPESPADTGQKGESENAGSEGIKVNDD